MGMGGGGTIKSLTSCISTGVPGINPLVAGAMRTSEGPAGSLGCSASGQRHSGAEAMYLLAWKSFNF